MNAPPLDPPTHPARGWVLYDRDCSVCASLARRFEAVLARRGFAMDCLQSAWVGPRLGLGPERLLEEMQVLTSDGRALGGADGFFHLARFVVWGWPLHLLGWIPGVKPLARLGYRWFAAHRKQFGSTCRTDRGPGA